VHQVTIAEKYERILNILLLAWDLDLDLDLSIDETTDDNIRVVCIDIISPCFTRQRLDTL